MQNKSSERGGRGREGRIGGRTSKAGSRAYDEKILRARPGAEIFKKACPLFVPLVEEGRIGQNDQVLRLVAEGYLTELRATGIDTLILGCTHYPLIAGTVREVMGPEVTLIDTGAETAERLRRELARTGALAERARGGYTYYVTDSAEDFGRSAALFLGTHMEGDVHRVTLEERV